MTAEQLPFNSNQLKKKNLVHQLANTMTHAHNLLRKTRRHPLALCAAALTLAAAAVYLVWGGTGLSALFGGVVGLSLPLLLGESSAATGDRVRHGGWNWDGSPDDGGGPYGRSIFED